MIQDIKELNLPKYATLSQAECSLQDMGEWVITTQVKIDGDITPDFSKDWEVEFMGAKYIMPLRKPQATKENTSLNSTVDLTFQHWAVWQLKRWYFFSLPAVETGTVVPDRYMATVSLNLVDFCDLFGKVLNYYYGDTITIDLNPQWSGSPDPTNVEINNSKNWNVLTELYKLYDVRWWIEPNGDINHYVIKVGYPITEVDHIFEYGFKGGLLKIEHQVQDVAICNMMLGRGGSKNLPYRYFKDVDPQNPTFPADPDWIPELRNIYFSELRGKTFRDYVKGWKTNQHRQLTESDGTPIKPYGSNVAIKVEPYDPNYAASSWAYKKGHDDEVFTPVEFVADEIVSEPQNGDKQIAIFPNYTPWVKAGSSIDKYGPILDSVESNEDIYPSIQGIDPEYDNPDVGRIDEVIDVEQITSDDVEQAAEATATERTVNVNSGTCKIAANSRGSISVISREFSVDEGTTANFDEGERTIKATWQRHTFGQNYVTHDIDSKLIVVEKTTTVAIDQSSYAEVSAVGLQPGTYYCRINLNLHNTSERDVTVTVDFPKAKIKPAVISEQWGNTFNIWIKNLWGSFKLASETAEQYVERVWRPILGDHEGNEAKVAFSDGMLGMSEDYEFTIIKDGVHYDTSKSFKGVPSEWRLTLAKSDADLETLGLYVPSTMRQGKAGDHIIFTGIDLLHQYVLWAEERVDQSKSDKLLETREINPAIVVSLDKVRIHNKQAGEAQTLISKLRPGCSCKIYDKRFIDGAHQETRFIQSIKYIYNEPTSDDAGIIPDVEVVLSDKFDGTASTMDLISGEISALSKQVGSLSNIEQIVKMVGDKLYLRKDGMPDRSMSPTEFASLLTSLSFRSGIVGGAGWGFFKDENGNWVLEVDKLNIRQEMQVNNLVINQITARGGMIVESTASMEINRVAETKDGYVCYFDQKNGTIANLFREGDVALCHRFNADAITSDSQDALKFYKRRVVAVDGESVTLTKGYEAVILEDGTTDTGVNGSGTPAEGDIIVQYGSYTDPQRRYVIIRDVIGGGYERYIEGLNSVNSNGTEYFFVGRQNGSYENKARFFLGDKDNEFIEFRNGKLTIKGNIAVESTIGDKTMLDYITELTNTSLASLSVGGVNMLRNTDFSKGFKEWALTPEASFSVVNGLNNSLDGRRSLSVNVTSNNYYNISQEIATQNVADDYVLSFYVKTGLIITSLYPQISIDAKIGNKVVSVLESLVVNNIAWKKVVAPFSIKRLTSGIQSGFQLIITIDGGSTTVLLNGFKLERGNLATAWERSPLDNSYLIKALQETTTIAGGLILTTYISLGTTDSNGNFNEMSGINGAVDEDAPGSGLAIWTGGKCIDEQVSPGNGAKMAFRHDGTGYASGNLIRFEKDHVAIGLHDILKLFSDGLYMISNGIPRVKLINEQIQGDVLSVSSGTIINLPIYNLDCDYSTQGNAWLSCVQFPISIPINGGNIPSSAYINDGSIEVKINSVIGGNGSYEMPKLSLSIRKANSTTDIGSPILSSFSAGSTQSTAKITLSDSNKLYIPAAGLWDLIIGIVNADGAYPINPKRTTATITGHLDCKFSRPADMITIGPNGQSIVSSNGTFKFYGGKSCYFGVRVGQYVLEISNNNGIRVSKKGGDGTDWKTLI